MEEGHIEIDSISPISFGDITPALARSTGFTGVVDLLKVAKHGSGENVYLVRFHYIPPTDNRVSRAKTKSSASHKKQLRERTTV
jgi:hypothetical protein